MPFPTTLVDVQHLEYFASQLFTLLSNLAKCFRHGQGVIQVKIYFLCVDYTSFIKYHYPCILCILSKRTLPHLRIQYLGMSNAIVFKLVIFNKGHDIPRTVGSCHFTHILISNTMNLAFYQSWNWRLASLFQMTDQLKEQYRLTGAKWFLLNHSLPPILVTDLFLICLQNPW